MKRVLNVMVRLGFQTLALVALSLALCRRRRHSHRA